MVRIWTSFVRSINSSCGCQVCSTWYSSIYHEHSLVCHRVIAGTSWWKCVKIWVNYAEYVNVIQRILHAEHIGDCVLHLQCIFIGWYASSMRQDTLPIAKLTGLYVQGMGKLADHISDGDYEDLTKRSQLTICHKDKPLVPEQELMWQINFR